MAGFSRSLQQRFSMKNMKKVKNQIGKGKKIKRTRKPQKLEIKFSKKLKKSQKRKKG